MRAEKKHLCVRRLWFSCGCYVVEGKLGEEGLPVNTRRRADGPVGRGKGLWLV